MAIGFLSRLAIAAYTQNDILRGNSLHDTAALQILSGNGLGRTYSSPGYALFLAGAYAIFGHNWMAIGLTQAAVGAFSIGLVFSIAKTMFGRKTAVVAAVITALYPYSVYQASRIIDTTVFTFFLLAAVWTIIKVWPRHTYQGFLALGSILGLGYLVRGTMLTVLISVVFWLMLVFGSKQGIIAISFCLLGMVLVLVSWILPNLYASGHLIPIYAKGMQNVYMGNNPLTLEYMEKRVSLDKIWEDGRLPRPYPEMAAAERDEWYLVEIIKFIKHDPILFSKLLPTKIVAFWSVRLNPDPVTPLPGSLKILREPIYTLSYAPLLGLALLGLILSIGQREEPMLFIFIFVSFTIFHMMGWSATRLRIPLDSFLAIFAGYGLIKLLRRYW